MMNKQCTIPTLRLQNIIKLIMIILTIIASAFKTGVLSRCNSEVASVIFTILFDFK